MTGRDLLTIAEAAKRLPYKPGAMYQKIHRGRWRDGKEYQRDPDGRIWISLSGVEAWIKGGDVAG